MSALVATAQRRPDFFGDSDGAESSETGAQGLVTVSTLRCDGAAFVLALRIETPAGDATNDVRYELIDGGKRLRATEQGRSPMGNHDAVWIYDRR